MQKTKDLGLGVSLIDLFDLGKEKRTGTYVLHEEELTIIETSASPSIPYLLKGLELLGIDPKDIKNIIVTHIHLDHAGGVGLLLESCPNAHVIVHPRGERHLADPSRLIQGAKAVYGSQFDVLFDPILPVPEDRLVVKEDGDTLQIGENRTLTFMDTPGHAKHHFSIHDSFSNGVFTGDTIGVFYPQLLPQGVELYLPSTSPNQFDPEAMLQSLERIEALKIDRIYFGHYGMSTNPHRVSEQIRFWLPKFMATGEKVWLQNLNSTEDEKNDALFQALFEEVSSYLTEKNVSLEQDIYEIIKLDLTVGSMGVIDYFRRRTRQVC
ncbi:MBL fold metallo-hydrolase [Bacillus sp. FJAT-29790]|uniref:MBL fold metallo-hydrolase n=1 Tax=Bacillus sp. FJAT-29790 TaxID=1895002 RepID=UPI001C242AEC|nr:MBL fold metallo-hydrolase [Bacillus sp. FJAT-29790]MBU8880139.1 MBL fold metallo-hydrolase [Bacillus sp. FJAT-29790]